MHKPLALPMHTSIAATRLRQLLPACAFALTALCATSAALAQVVAPSVALTDTTTAPGGTAVGTVVYNTATAGSGALSVRPGAYVWTGAEWRLADSKYFNVNSSLGNSVSAGANSVAIGPASTATGTNAVAIGTSASATGVGGVGSVAIGGGNPAANYTNPVNGLTTNLTNITNRAGTAVGFGSQANAAGDGAGSAFGTYAVANGGAYNTAIGYRSDASASGSGVGANPNYSGAVVIGAFSTASGTGATVLGANSVASVAGGVALGNFSLANTAAGALGFQPFGSSVANVAAINATNSTFLAAVSVGGGSAGGTALGTRQITNVAAGTRDNDAVNVSQLKALSAAVAALPAGAPGTVGPAGPVGATGVAGVAGPSGPTGAVGPVGSIGLTGQTGPAGPTGATGVNGLNGANGPAGVSGPTGATGATGATTTPAAPAVAAGSNITASVLASGAQVQISTVASPTFTAVTTGSIVAGNINVAPGGTVAMGNNAVTQVANGVASTDAANMSQLASVGEQGRQYTDTRFNQLSADIVDNQKSANAGAAAAMAMAGMPQAFAPGKSMLAAGVATYAGQSAIAIGLSKLSESGKWLLKINGAANTRGKAGVSVGAGMSW